MCRVPNIYSVVVILGRTRVQSAGARHHYAAPHPFVAWSSHALIPILSSLVGQPYTVPKRGQGQIGKKTMGQGLHPRKQAITQQ